METKEDEHCESIEMKADYVYVTLEELPVFRTKEIFPGVYVDYADGDKVIGIEFVEPETVSASRIK